MIRHHHRRRCHKLPGVRLRGPLTRLKRGVGTDKDVANIARAIWRHNEGRHFDRSSPRFVEPIFEFGDIEEWVRGVEDWSGLETLELLAEAYAEWVHDLAADDNEEWDISWDYDDDEDLDDDDMWADYPGELIVGNADYGKEES